MDHFEFPNGVIRIHWGLDAWVSGLPGAEGLGGQDGGKIVIVTDRNVLKLHEGRVERLREAWSGNAVVHVLPPGEESKSLTELGRLLETLAGMGMGRDGGEIALGGGVVSDLAGLAAAVWMRGVEWVAVPTTMEAMVDACLGGKTGINLAGGKNLIGAFHHPTAIVIEPEFLRTLPPRDVRAGLAESIKHALLFDEAFLRFHEENREAILDLDAAVTREVISRNLKFKAEVVRRDPLERGGERRVLNFGHTLGHALETACGYRLRHGECVGLGMLAACRLSARRGLLDGAVVERVAGMLGRFGLPTRMEAGIEADAVVEAMRRDKKARGGAAVFVLLRGIGRPEVVEDVDAAEIREELARLMPG